ncbi:recombinase zinc beta ribbon domain-containing protein [Sphingomonas hankookensis]|uniref:recombinase zinc beta ribbon domain-containing protein n=1 Tax=Sphingomonas hankookensis TaxID=563996 RepID=UPI003D301C08
MISVDLVGCSTARNKGTCDNRKNIRRDQLEARVLNALRHHLMTRRCSRNSATSSRAR